MNRALTPEIVAALPGQPGSYRFYNAQDELIYVGKAKNLRRRLSQYRLASKVRGRAPKIKKMRKILREVRRLEFSICENEYEALALENEWIQRHRPKWNVAGAFSFLYPMIGTRVDSQGYLYLCYTTHPEAFSDFQFHGAFRSRDRTKEAFFALNDLLRWVGHRIPRTQLIKTKIIPPISSRGICTGFRQVPEEFRSRLGGFLRGEDFSPIQDLCLLLLDHAGAIAQSAETQEHLFAIRRFWKHEITPLKRARDHSAWPHYPVRQQDRDPLFIALRSSGEFRLPLT